MLRESEARHPPASNLALLDRLVGQIRPEEASLGEWLSRYHQTHRARLASDLRIIQRHAKPHATILEYGAIPLLMTAALDELGFQVEGLDIAPDRFATAISDLRLRVHRCDVEKEAVPCGSATFDLVLFNELFEHLRINPIFTLGEAHRVLKPDGRLLLSTPNLRSLWGLRNLLVHDLGYASSGGIYEQFEKLDTLGHMGHVREYTVREVSDFLGRIGFEVDKVIFRGGHQAGLVGVAERTFPGLRPFFTLVARKVGDAYDAPEPMMKVPFDRKDQDARRD